MIQAIEKYISDNFEIFGLKDKPGRLSFLLATLKQSKKYEFGKIVYLIFKGEDLEPFLVAKMCRHRSYESHLKNEVHNVKTILATSQCDCVAKPLLLVTLEGRLILFEEYVPGRSLKSELYDLTHGNDHTDAQLQVMVQKHFLLAQQCIKKLNAGCSSVPKAEMQQEIAGLLTKHQRTIGFPGNAPGIAKEIDYLMRRIPAEVPKRITHYDFNPANIKAHGDHGKIIDFEFSGLSTLPCLEPVRFVIYYFADLLQSNTFASHDYTIELFEHVLYEKSWFTDIVDDFLERTVANYHYRDKRAYCYLFFLFDNLLQYDVVHYTSDHFITALRNRLRLGIATHFEQSVEASNQIIAQQQQQIQNIYHSRGWKLVSFLHRVKKKFIHT